MQEELIISVLDDFSDDPFGRDADDDVDNNGMKFLEEVLKPAMREATRIVVNMDGVKTGYGSSWLDAAFVEPIRQGIWTKAEFLQRVTLVYQDEPYIADQVIKWIKEL